MIPDKKYVSPTLVRRFTGADEDTPYMGANPQGFRQFPFSPMVIEYSVYDSNKGTLKIYHPNVVSTPVNPLTDGRFDLGGDEL